MRRTELMQEVRIMRFDEAYVDWKSGKITQETAARLLGVCERTFRRYKPRYEAEGLRGLADRRLGQGSHRRASDDEVAELTELYRKRYEGFNSKHFHSWYRRAHQGKRSYTWVKSSLQGAGLVSKSDKKGTHRKKRPRV